MKALRRSHTSSTNSSNGSPSLNSDSNSPTSSSPSSSWIHLRSLIVVVASSPASSDRGSLKSPWSRRKRKRALSKQQWESCFTQDGKLRDGGRKFLKKIRSGGIDQSIRAEVWPFLLGVYDLNSTEAERMAIRTERRNEYEELRRQCLRLGKQMDVGDKEMKTIDEIRVTEIPNLSGSPDLSESSSLSDILEDDKEMEGVDEGSDAESPNVFEDCESSDSEYACSTSAKPCHLVNQGKLDNSDRDHTEKEYKNKEIHIEEAESGLTQADESSVGSESPKSSSSSEDDTTQSMLTSTPEGSNTKNDSKQAESRKTSEDFATWQRIIRLDAIRANAEWMIYSPTQAAISEGRALEFAKSVGLKNYDNLEPCKIYHASRLVAILEAYALYDQEIGYCQGMSDLLSPILAVMEEDDDAFWCFVGFMRKARHNFRLDEVGIRRQLNIVSKIIKSKDSHLYRHLEKLQAEDCFFVYRMVIVLFRRELDFEQTLCLWEVMWADQAAIRAGIGKSAWGRIRSRAPPTDDLLLYAIAACVLQRRKLIIESYSSMDEIIRECNNMTGHLDVWKLLDDAHDLVVTLNDRISMMKAEK